jgi:alpha-ketoglutarate-dependent taurine dioxygenase
MSPAAIDVQTPVVSAVKSVKSVADVVAPSSAPAPTESTFPKPHQLSGALDQVDFFDVTPTIGREFKDVDLVEWLNAPNSDELIRDLAITISQRGVVFFRAQNNLTNELQKELILRLGQLSGRPATSGLHIHPAYNPQRENGGSDLEISTISSVQHKRYYRRPSVTHIGLSNKSQSAADWHSDISFEPVPADYTSLRLVQLPKTGGDTLWASGYEIYDRLSEPYQKFLEGLTATFEQEGFKQAAARGGFELYDQPRGAPQNIGKDLRAIHPVVRTNPVTGWKSVFPVGEHVKHINGVTQEESDHLLKWFLDILYQNHDLQVRFKWQNSNDLGKSIPRRTRTRERESEKG